MNYTGDKLKRNIYLVVLACVEQIKWSVVVMGGEGRKKINVFWSVCRNIRSHESELITVGKHF